MGSVVTMSQMLFLLFLMYVFFGCYCLKNTAPHCLDSAVRARIFCLRFEVWALSLIRPQPSLLAASDENWKTLNRNNDLRNDAPTLLLFSMDDTNSFRRYIGYGKDQSAQGKSFKGETVMSLLCLIQSVLLGSFAAILGAHRSEILDKPTSYDEMQNFPSVSHGNELATDYARTT